MFSHIFFIRIAKKKKKKQYTVHVMDLEITFFTPTNAVKNHNLIT